MKMSYIATGLTGFITGILLSSLLGLDIYFGLLFLLLAVVFFVQPRFRTNLAVFFLFIFLGILRFEYVDVGRSVIRDGDFGFVKAEGVILDEPSVKDKNITFEMSLGSLSDQRNLPIYFEPMTLLINSNRIYEQLSYGDKVSVIGDLKRVENFSSTFDYRAYLAKDEIYFQFLNPKIFVVSHNNGSWLQAKLFEVKESFLRNVDAAISEPESSLMGGLILGAKSSLDKNLTEEFKRVGLIHIVALSGYNVTVVADSLMKAVWFLPLIPKLLIGSAFIILFALMTGGGSTIVRASLMVLLAMLARATGRIYIVGSALLVAAIIMIAYSPKILVFDTSFQLSFLATAGLIFFTPVLEKYLSKVTGRLGLRGALVSTLSAQLAVWPIILYKMGNFSLVSIPANLLVGPVIPYTMFLGFATGSLGYVSSFVASILGGISYVFLHYIVKVTELFSALPFASITVSQFPLFLVIAIYIAYVVLVVASEHTK